MSISLLGKDRLGAILDGTQRIVVSNRTSLENGVTINSLAVGLHGAEGNIRFRTLAGTSLGPDESLVVDDDRPVEEKIVAVEAFMRLTGEGVGQILEAYVKVELEGTATSLGDIELGISQAYDGSVAGATVIDEAPDFAVFARGNS
jgi:hypothetical protein